VVGAGLRFAELDQYHFTRLGKYYFVQQSRMQRAVDSLAPKKIRTLFVASAPLRGVRVIDSVQWQAEKAYLMTR